MLKTRLTALALLLGLTGGTTAAALAQEVIVAQYAPAYTTWQPAWDRFEYDRNHVILGTVVHFSPYRLEIARRDGDVQTIDLKHGTIIFPTGATPSLNERAAIVGYYSNGTFIANRLILR